MYRVTDLGDFGYIGPNNVEAVNNQVAVVGWNIFDSESFPGGIRFYTRGYHWADGVAQAFTPLPGAQYCWAMDINDDGIVVGRSLQTGGEAAGCLLIPGEEAQPISLIGGRALSANAVNRFGLVVGGAIRDDGRRVPFSYDLATGQSQFIEIDAAEAAAGAVNDAGVIIGQFQLQPGGPTRPFLVEPGQPAIDLNARLPAGSNWLLEYAYDINNHGEIVGEGRRSGAVRAFRGMLSGEDDPEELAPLPGDVDSHVAAINDDGLAVGYSFYFQVPAARWTAVVWAWTEAIDINTRLVDAPAGAWFEGVRDLNNRGHLVARGVASWPRQYLLTPICAEDLDGDGSVELSDLAALLACFGSTCSDVDGDGDCDLADLARLLARFGGPCP